MAVLVCQVVDVFNLLHWHDFLIGPSAVHILIAEFLRWPHSHQGDAALAEIELRQGAAKTGWPPPAPDIFRVAPGFPDLFKRRIENAGYHQVLFHRGHIPVSFSEFSNSGRTGGLLENPELQVNHPLRRGDAGAFQFHRL
jgi:hypothetical protein